MGRLLGQELLGLVFNQGDSQTSHTSAPMATGYCGEDTEEKTAQEPGEEKRYKLQNSSTGGSLKPSFKEL